jgi:hypothetical protein
MNKDMQKTVYAMSEDMADFISNDLEERSNDFSEIDNTHTIATLEVARQLALLTEQVRAMVVMQTEAMAMAKAMIEKFKGQMP